MFEHVTHAPPDAIFGLSEAFRKDPNPDKINLGAGVYKDEDGRTPVLDCVKQAEARLLATEPSKSYLPIDGASAYGVAVRELIFGADHEVVTERRAVTAHNPGGTGALRVAADLMKHVRPDVNVWLSEPTWPNHPQIFEAVGLEMKSYPYFDEDSNDLAFERMIRALGQVRANDVVLLHGCCHNPTGVDPTIEEWARIGDVLAERGAVPLLDFAYQGLASGVREDPVGIRALCERVPELMVCSSFSKNFGLYAERVGALTVVAASEERAQAVCSQVKRLVRANYSNPPVHGSAIVTTVLGDAGLSEQWLGELKQMRERIHHMRQLFASELDRRGVMLSAEGNDFIARQRGMFSFSGLDRLQVARLRDEHSIYIVGSGRLNVAGMTESNMPRLCDAIAAVTSAS
ncbi:MAG: aspartate/tyrosine/aromatic aminotransferase [bacterium]|nr:aspartate/tyrosine/aromatic aminotransferase [bacterium]